MDNAQLEMEEKIRISLREVVDPEIGMDIIALGLIRDIQVQPEDNAHIVMILTTPFCPYGPQLMEQTRKVAEITSSLPTTIEMGAEMWDRSYMEEGAGGDWGLYY